MIYIASKKINEVENMQQLNLIEEKKELMEIIQKLGTALTYLNLSVGRLDAVPVKLDKIINLLEQINNNMMVNHETIK